MQKKCGNSQCEILEPIFHKDRSSRDGLQFFCKECRRIKDSEYRKTEKGKSVKRLTMVKFRKTEKGKAYIESYYSNPDNKRNRKNTTLKRKYGITIDDYELLIKKQKESCAICGINKSELKIGLVVDHNHQTEKIRGLLCSSCNKGLGHFRVDSSFLRKAIKYVVKGNKRQLRGE